MNILTNYDKIRNKINTFWRNVWILKQFYGINIFCSQLILFDNVFRTKEIEFPENGNEEINDQVECPLDLTFKPNY